MKYTAGWNYAGYLPETDPETFDTLDAAYGYLRETIERWADEDEASDDAGALDMGPDYVDGWYGDIHLWAEPTLDASPAPITARCGRIDPHGYHRFAEGPAGWCVGNQNVVEGH